MAAVATLMSSRHRLVAAAHGQHRLYAGRIFSGQRRANGHDLGGVELDGLAVRTGQIHQIVAALGGLQCPGNAADIGAGLGRQAPALLHPAWPGIVGGKHPGIAVALVQPAQIGGARQDIVARIHGIVAQLVTLGHLVIGGRHHLHQADGAGAADDGLVVGEHGAAAGFLTHHGADPGLGDMEALRGFADEGVPAIQKLRRGHLMFFVIGGRRLRTRVEEAQQHGTARHAIVRRRLEAGILHGHGGGDEQAAQHKRAREAARRRLHRGRKGFGNRHSGSVGQSGTDETVGTCGRSKLFSLGVNQSASRAFAPQQGGHNFMSAANQAATLGTKVPARANPRQAFQR